VNILTAWNRHAKLVGFINLDGWPLAVKAALFWEDKMKVIKKGNKYKKAGWFKEHEDNLFILGCAISGFLCLVFAILIRG